MKRIFLTLLIGCTSALAAHAQFTHTGLDTNTELPYNENPYYYPMSYMPRLKVENDTLFACRMDGIYCKPLLTDAPWRVYAFEGQPIMEFARYKGQIVAIRYNVECDAENKNLLLHSTDCGRTFTDITPSQLRISREPDQFCSNYFNTLVNLLQNPQNPQSVFVHNAGETGGSCKSCDFGQTWDKCRSAGGDNMVYHPTDSMAQYAGSGDVHGYAMVCWTHDGGKTWKDYLFNSETGYMIGFAFHPTDPETIIGGGSGFVCMSQDKGSSWDVIVPHDYTARYAGYDHIMYDNQNPDILYATCTYFIDDNSLCILRSTDGGSTWAVYYQQALGANAYPTDMVQHGDKLYIYTCKSGVLAFDKRYEPTGIAAAEGGVQCRAWTAGRTLHYAAPAGTSLSLTQADGRTALRLAVDGTGSVSVAHLPTGVYVCTLQPAGGTAQRVKLLIE